MCCEGGERERTWYSGFFRTPAPALQTASETAKMALAPNCTQRKIPKLVLLPLNRGLVLNQLQKPMTEFCTKSLLQILSKAIV
jgi:hypothetical protein